MYIDKLMNKFGYSEMYEWSELFKFNIVPYGRFVTFDNNEHGKISVDQYQNLCDMGYENNIAIGSDFDGADMANELCGICAGDQCEIDAPAVKKFVCKVCGYVYEGDELPEDFVCPLCKHGAADFEPIK